MRLILDHTAGIDKEIAPKHTTFYVVYPKKSAERALKKEEKLNHVSNLDWALEAWRALHTAAHGSERKTNGSRFDWSDLSG